jgi:hypothetical protein
MRAAALAAAIIAGFLGVMYLRFSGDTVPAPPTPRLYTAGQPTCVVFRRVSAEGGDPDPNQAADCGAIRAAPEPSPVVTPVPVQRSPYARVVNTDGTCLNIRVLPSTSAAALDRAAEGVFLVDRGQTAESEGIIWLRVATPNGVEGWASTQYLER